MSAIAVPLKAKTGLLAVRQQGATFELFDGSGTSLGTAHNAVELWNLMGVAMGQADDIEMPTPEQLALEKVVRETGAAVGGFMEKRHPGSLQLFNMFMRGATMAQQRGYFDRED